MDDVIKILILEDNPDDVALIKSSLRHGDVRFKSEQVKSKWAYQAALSDFEPDIVLADHTLPQFNSLKALELAQQIRDYLGFILVTGTVSEEFAVTVMKKGADDYLLKSSLKRLPQAVTRTYEKKCAQWEKDTAEQELFSFIQRVSHDIENPLGSITHLSEVAQKETTDQRARKTFSLIEESTAQLQSMLQSLIQCISVKHESHHPKKIDFINCVEEVKKQLKPIAGFGDMQVRINCEEHPPFYTNKALLQCILQNILENAIKYRDDSVFYPYVQLEFEVTPEQGQITVSDNGIGISKEQQNYIFEKYVRENKREHIKGSGVGLFIVKEALHKLNGEISVDSIAGEGTTFYVTIPNDSSSQ